MFFLYLLQKQYLLFLQLHLLAQLLQLLFVLQLSAQIEYLLLQYFYFYSQLLDLSFRCFEESFEFGNGVLFVYFWLVHDVSGSGTKAQGTKGFLVVERVGRACNHQTSFGISSEGVRQNPGQLRFSVWYVRGLFVREGHNNLPESSERFIDALSFFKRLALGSSLEYFL